MPQIASSSDNCNLSFQEISTQEQLKDPCLVVKRFNDIFYTIWPIRIQLEARLTLNVTTFLGFLKHLQLIYIIHDFYKIITIYNEIL